MPKTTTLVQPACEMCTAYTCKGVCDTIYADNNAVGRSITRYVPALYHLERAAPGDFSEYCNPNADRGPVASELRSALARREDVERHQLVIDGPGLGRMQRLPTLFGATDVVVATQDFPGFRKAAASSDLPLHEIGYDEHGDAVDTKKAVELVRGLDRPITMVTAPITNPGQARVSLEFVHAVAEANPNGIVVIDPAYAASVPSFDRHDAVRLALGSENILYMNVAAKDLGACGTRVSWYIANELLLGNADARSITREEHEDARQVARDLAKTDEYAIAMKLRKKVEMLFAHLKRILGLSRLRLRGPCGANDEFLLAATAQNLRKLAKIFPAPQQMCKA